MANPTAGTATAAPTPALIAARAPLVSWPARSTPLPRPVKETSAKITGTSTATRAYGRQHIRSTAPVPVVPRLALRGVTI